MVYLRQTWSQSKTYRAILIVVVIYALLRLVVQGVFLVGMLFPDQTQAQSLPDDLRIYLEAAGHLHLGQDLYPKTVERWEFYQYAPSYALAFTPFLWLTPFAAAIIHTLLHVVAYGLLYVWWGRIFRRLGLERASEMLVWLLPVWFIFSVFWGDLGYLNVYIIMALLATLLIDAVLNERLGWAVLWLAIILQIKPQWAFAAAVPLFLGRRRFFFKLLALAVVAYATIVGLTMLTVGLSYGWQQYGDYFRLLLNLLHRNYPWRTLADGFLGYNHSITQTIVYLLGVSPGTFRLATGIKVLLLAPLAVVSLRCLCRPANRAGRDVPLLGLDLTFALYLGAFIWLDVIWELALGMAVFTYLLATLEQQGARRLAWLVFLPYALVDVWRLASFVLFGPGIVVPGPYILTDLSVYVPLTMIVILTFYALLVRRLWSAVPVGRAVKEG